MPIPSLALLQPSLRSSRLGFPLLVPDNLDGQDHGDGVIVLMIMFTINQHVMCSHLCCIWPEASDAVGYVGIHPEDWQSINFVIRGHPYIT